MDDLELNARPYPLIHVRFGKGMRARTLALEKKVAQALKNYLVQRSESLSDAVFLNHYGESLGERGVRKIIAKYVRAQASRSGSVHTAYAIRLRHRKQRRA